MTKYEKGIKLPNGLDIYRPVPYEDVALLLEPFLAPVDFTGRENMELRSPTDPNNCPAVNILPRGWFKDRWLPPDMSIADLQEYMVDNCPSLIQPVDVSVNFSVYKGNRSANRFITAVPDEESGALFQMERSSIMEIASKTLEKDKDQPGGLPGRKYMDITLAFINPEIEASRMQELYERISVLSSRSIRLEPMMVELGTLRGHQSTRP